MNEELAPEADAALLLAHRIGDPSLIAAEFMRILRTATPVQVSQGDHVVMALVAEVADGDVVLQTPDEEAWGHLNGPVTLVALYAAAKVQCRLILLADGPLRMRSPMPEEMHRIQRRRAFRVAPPPEAPLLATVRSIGALAIIDVSVVGIALSWPEPFPIPPLDTRLPSVLRMGPDKADQVPCVLTVRRIGEASEKSVPVGFGLELAPAAERGLLKALLEVERQHGVRRGRRSRGGETER